MGIYDIKRALNKRLGLFMSDYISIRWVIAMKSEAVAVCEWLCLKSVVHEGPFPIFSDLARRHWLVISGVGRVQAAAATMYLYNISAAKPWSIWVNLGIAGHGRADYGTLFLVDKIVERSTGQRLYPRSLINLNVFEELNNAITLVEWPEIILGLLQNYNYFYVNFNILDENMRSLKHNLIFS